jgi:hypothetical protein
VSWIKTNGITTGKVEINIRKKIAIDSLISSCFRCTSIDGSGMLANLFLISSSPSVPIARLPQEVGPSEIYSLALAVCEESRTASNMVLLLLFRANTPMRYIVASTIPQARLQPIAPISNCRISVGPLLAMPMEQVKLRAIINPNKISATLSIGFNNNLNLVLPSIQNLKFKDDANHAEVM